MPKIIRIHLSPEQLDDLNERARRRDLTPQERERLEMIRLSHLGLTIPQIAAHLDRHQQTVRRIISGFLDVGFAILPDQPRPGRPATLTEEVLAVLLGCAGTVSIPAGSTHCTAGLASPPARGGRTAPYPASSTAVNSSHARIRSGGCGTAGSPATSPSR